MAKRENLQQADEVKSHDKPAFRTRDAERPSGVRNTREVLCRMAEILWGNQSAGEMRSSLSVQSASTPILKSACTTSGELGV